jgi:hypothetical protein
MAELYPYRLTVKHNRKLHTFVRFAPSEFMARLSMYEAAREEWPTESVAVLSAEPCPDPRTPEVA